MSEIDTAIDAALAAISARLREKQPIYEPDGEWTALMGAANALREARRALELAGKGAA